MCVCMYEVVKNIQRWDIEDLWDDDIALGPQLDVKICDRVYVWS